MVRQVLLLRQELPHLVLQNLICQPQVLPDLVKHIISQHVVYTSSGKLHIIAIAEIHLKVHKVFLISKSGVRNENSKVHSSHFVLALELTILTLVRSFREANFCLYREKLAELLPYFFANNNVNYAWWL